MSDFSNFELPIPKSWDTFEDLCADVFSAEFHDVHLVRHGRSGQRQQGVDIKTRTSEFDPIGLQCKKKTSWPVTKMSTSEIDAEVKEALGFSPQLKSFIILTTVNDCANLQAHARKISEDHKKKGLFEVTVLGWGEILRRANNHPQVMDKHFGFLNKVTKNFPLLKTWFLRNGELENQSDELQLDCEDLAYEFEKCNEGLVAIRMRESDEIVEKLAGFSETELSLDERRERRNLRTTLKRNEEMEKRASDGVKLLLGESDLFTYITKIHFEENEAACVVNAFVKDAFDLNSFVVDLNTHKYVVQPSGHPDIRAIVYLTESELSLCDSLSQKRFEMYKKHILMDTVDEFPHSIRSEKIIPSIISALLFLLKTEDISKLRNSGLLNISTWGVYGD